MPADAAAGGVAAAHEDSFDSAAKAASSERWGFVFATGQKVGPAPTYPEALARPQTVPTGFLKRDRRASGAAVPKIAAQQRTNRGAPLFPATCISFEI